MKLSCKFIITMVLATGLWACSGEESGTGSVSVTDNEQDGPFAILLEGTGTYSRPISTDSEPAQQFFDQGLRLVWGYHFPEAAASFQEAIRHDPDHPILHWGLALAAGPNPNTRYLGGADDPQGVAREAINRAYELRNNVEGVERQLVEALYLRYDTENFFSQDANDQAFYEVMADMQARYPDDPDIASLYADSFMIRDPWHYWDDEGIGLPGTEDVASVLERMSSRFPEHPGVNHLYIHLVEASRRPERALSQARQLEGLMPAVGHVVHMPTHTYVRTGDYEKAIALNGLSEQADVEFKEQWGNLSFPDYTTHQLSASTHTPHATEFIRYAASVQGNYAKALEAARKTTDFRVNSDPPPWSGDTQRAIAHQWYLHKMFAHWDGLRAENMETGNSPYLEGMRMYLEGSMHIHEGDLSQADDLLSELQTLAQTPVVGNTRYRITEAGTLLSLFVNALEGEIEEARSNNDAAIAAFSRAVEIEDQILYIEPPDWPQPMRHYLGAALVSAERFEEAEAVYRRDMLWSQNNGWSLKGLQLSLEGQGRTEEAEEVERQFNEAWANADVTLDRSRL